MAQLVLLPGETAADAILRRIKMHEFLMSGGVYQGLDARGCATYGPPLKAEEHPICPFHNRECDAWEEIRAGRGHFSRLRTALEAAKIVGDIQAVESLEKQLEAEPRDARALRERSKEQVEAEISAAKREKQRRRAALAAQAEAAKKIALGLKHVPHFALFREWGDVDPETVLCDEHQDRKSRAISQAHSDTDIVQWHRIPKSRSYGCVICRDEKRFDAAPVKPLTKPFPWSTDEDTSWKPKGKTVEYSDEDITWSDVKYTREPDAIDVAIDVLGEVEQEQVIEIEGDEGEETEQ